MASTSVPPLTRFAGGGATALAAIVSGETRSEASCNVGMAQSGFGHACGVEHGGK